MILNLTQHAATPDQVAAGVVDLHSEIRGRLQSLLTFDDRLPSRREVDQRASQIVQLIHDLEADQAMIGGAQYLMAPLEAALNDIGIEPVYAFSERVSAEERQADGSVRKVNVFRHVGFVPA